MEEESAAEGMIRIMRQEEIIYVDREEIVCDGGGGPLGHPRVFLRIKPDTGTVECGYCDRKFVLRGHDARAA